MVKYLIIDNVREYGCHRILRVALFTSEYYGQAFMQELRYYIDEKKHDQTTFELSIEAAKKMMGAL